MNAKYVKSSMLDMGSMVLIAIMQKEWLNYLLGCRFIDKFELSFSWMLEK